MEVTNHAITYKEIEDGKVLENDKYGIGSLFTKYHRETFLANPFLKDHSETLIYLSRVDGEIAGIEMLFPGLLLANNEIIYTQQCSTLEVAKEFRHLGLGIDIMLYPLSYKYDIIIYAGISAEALPIYKKIGFKVLEFPRYMQLRKSKTLLKSKGFEGLILNITSWIIDKALYLFRGISLLKVKKLEKQFKIKEEREVPQWVDTILLKDNHKYKEYHNQKWMEWNLNYNLHRRSQDTQHFYSIYDGNDPIGFFFLKERFRDVAGGVLRNVKIGSIMEWGSLDDERLSESDIYIFATSKFSDDVDIVEFATNNQETIYVMKRYLFIPHGNAHIIVNDVKKKYGDIGDINNWRIRFGYADVILT